MSSLFDFFNDDNARLMASVIAFSSFFLIGRLARASQKVAFAFAFTPLIAFAAVHTAVGAGLA